MSSNIYAPGCPWCSSIWNSVEAVCIGQLEPSVADHGKLWHLLVLKVFNEKIGSPWWGRSFSWWMLGGSWVYWEDKVILGFTVSCVCHKILKSGKKCWRVIITKPFLTNPDIESEWYARSMPCLNMDLKPNLMLSWDSSRSFSKTHSYWRDF